MSNRLRAGIFALVAIAAGVCPADAQQAPPARQGRPYRGLFGGGAGDTDQSLTFTLGLAGGYYGVTGQAAAGSAGDDGALPLPQRLPGNTSFGSAAGNLAYTLTRDRVGVQLGVASTGRYYSPNRDFLVGAHQATAGVSFQISERAGMSANHQLRLEPYNVLSLFPAVFDPLGGDASTVIDPDLQLGTTRFLSNDSTVGYSQQITKRVSFDAAYTHRATQTSSDNDLVLNGGSAGITAGLSKGLGLRLGYSRTQGRYSGSAGDNRVRTETIDAGVNYNRALSFSRRTRLSFGTGTAAVHDQSRTQYFVTGNATLTHEIGRSWDASVVYARNVTFLQTLQAPAIADTLSAGVAGLLSRRVSLRGTVGIAKGNVGLGSGLNGLQATRSSVAVSVALNRFMSLGGTYGYYRHRFQSDVVLPQGVSPRRGGQSVQVNLSLWMPLFIRTRSSNAAG